MKMTLSVNTIADFLRADDNAGWSYEGARALAEHLDQMDEETGEETEFDRVAIRCEFSEYGSALEAARNYGSFSEDDYEYEDELEQAAVEFLQDQTTLIEFDGGVIIRDF